MSALLVGGAILALLFSIVLAVVAMKSLRENRGRSAERIAALQAAVAETARPQAVDEPTAPALDVSMLTAREEPWDLELREPEVRSSKFKVQSSPQALPALEHALFEPAVQNTPGRRWTWIAATGLVIASVGGVFYAASTGAIGRLIATNAAKLNTTPPTPIELLSLRDATDPSGNFVVAGLVQNPEAGAPVRGAFAIVYLFDEEGKYFASSRAPLESAVLSPGGETAFTVKVVTSSLPLVSSLPSSQPIVSRYRVSFQFEDGAAVRHVDRRSAAPEGTTGTTVQTTPPATPLVAARKIG